MARPAAPGRTPVDRHLRRPSPGRPRGLGRRDGRSGRAPGHRLDPDAAGASRPGEGADRALLRGVLELRPGGLRAVDAARMPALAALMPDLLAMADRDVYVTGIEVFLDAIEIAASGEGTEPDA